MKTLITILSLALASTTSLMAGAGAGPWADGAYYPSGLNGKYQAVVYGNNITGVLGFALFNGAPPLLTRIQESPGTDGTVVRNVVDEPDPYQSYFSLFVEGRVYTGITTAGINLDNKEIAGTLRGVNPPGMPEFNFGNTGLDPEGLDPLQVVNRGLSGGFNAKIKKNSGLFTFKGDGELSTPANPQVVSAEANVDTVIRGPGDAPTGQTLTYSTTAQVETHSSPFGLSGIRTSFLSENPVLSADRLSTAGGGN